MTRKLTEGFEWGGNASNFTIPSNWPTIEGGVAYNYVMTADAKSWGYGSYSMSVLGWAYYVSTLWPSGTSELFMNWSWRLITADGSSQALLIRNTVGGDVLSLLFPSAATVNVSKANITTLVSLPVNNAWASWALRLKNTAGAFEVELKVNGTTVLDYADASPVGVTPNLAAIWLYPAGGEVRYDDIAINDTDGSVDNSWPGEISIKALAPNGNGDFNQWVGSDGNSTDNYLLVDEVGPSAADYVRTATANAEDWYNIASAPALTAGDTLDKVFVHVFARRVSAGPQTVSAGLKIGGSTVWGDPFTPLFLTYVQQHQTPVTNLNPDTGLTWTTDNIRYLQIGFRMNS